MRIYNTVVVSVCGAENISFGSGYGEPQIRMWLQLRLRIVYSWKLLLLTWVFVFFYIDWCMVYPNRIEIKILKIHKNFFINHAMFYKFLQDNRKEPKPKPEYIILAPAPGGSSASTPTLQHCLMGYFLLLFYFFKFFCQHCFICHPQIPLSRRMLGLNPRLLRL